jgi:hypothetical protein
MKAKLVLAVARGRRGRRGLNFSKDLADGADASSKGAGYREAQALVTAVKVRKDPRRRGFGP